MRIAVHPRLVEEAAFAAARNRAARGDPAPAEWLRRVLDRGYRLPPGPARDTRFERAHAVLFRRAGLARSLRNLLASHPPLAGAGLPVRVGPARGREQEGVDLFRRREPGGRVERSVVVSVLPATLAEPGLLAARLHRDALQVADLLDPGFLWEPPGPEPTPARRETVRLRYGAAWDAWTDGRLERRGLPPRSTPGEGESAFLAAFGAALPGEAGGEAFRRVRGAERLTHRDLLGFARDPSTLPGAPAAAAAGGSGPLPGAPCPLCRFPSHDWVPDPRSLSPGVRDAAEASLPGWRPEDGICGQCSLLLAAAAPGPREP